MESFSSEAKLKVYSASAGSGKTFSLTVEYLKHILKNPYAFKNVLAVTFTNKATNEMKNRILSVLWNMVYDREKAKDEIEKINGSKDATLSKEEEANARKALFEILHSYNNFWIETIDSFFQRVLRNLAREIGVSSGFELLINNKDYLVRAVEELKEDFETNTDLNSALKEFINDRIKQGKKWNYEKDMLKFAKELDKSIVLSAIKSLEYTDPKVIFQEIKDKLGFVRNFEDETNKHIAKVKQLCKEYGCEDWKKFFYKVAYKRYSINADNDNRVSKEPTKKLQKEYPELCEKVKVLQERFYVFYTKNFAEAYDNCVIYSSAYKFYLLKFIYQKRQSLLKEDNRFLLRDTQPLLNSMIQSGDVIPFIYEKLGSKINNIMIDEFQDTSTTAWENFKFLLEESLANGKSCAVFGDIKQSIYRWNDGDWQILKNLYDNSINDRCNIRTETETLKGNYRTDGKIVDFNNEFFQNIFKDKFGEKIGEEIKQIVCQEVKKNPENGELRFSFLEKEKEDNGTKIILEATKREIDYYISQGYELDDIVLLFRTKKQAKQVADFLKECDFSKDSTFKYNPCSSEAFALSANDEVRKIISALKFIANKKEQIAKYALENIYKIENTESLNQYRDVSISLIDLVMNLISDFDINVQNAFVAAFCDELTSYCSHHGNDIHKFLTYWEDSLNEKSVAIKKEKSSLELQTIHKSKGLEYNVVIIPFCDWDLVADGRSVWFDNFDCDSAVRVFSSTLSKVAKINSIYSHAVLIESFLQKVDNINLLYVALTRAKHCLSTISLKSKVSGFEKNVCDLLYNFLENNKGSSKTLLYNGEIFEVGNITPKSVTLKPKSDSSESESTLVNPFTYTPESIDGLTDCGFDFRSVNYALSKSATEYFEAKEENKINTKAVWGSLVHSALSKIRTEQDLEKAISNIEAENREQVKDVLNQMLEFIEAKHWFDGSYKVFNEKSIVDMYSEENESIKRPDRIMLNENELLIVDYKFLEDLDDLSKYALQIQEYGKRLSKMGFENIKLYLWGVETKAEKTNLDSSQMVLDFSQTKQRNNLLKQRVIEIEL